MVKTLDVFLTKHSKKFVVYYVLTILLFLILGAPDMTTILDKVFMAICIIIGMFFFPFTLKLAFKFQRSLSVRNIKIEQFQVMFFQVFAVMIILTVVVGIATDPKMLAYTLMVSNIGIMLTIELAKMREELRNFG